MAKEKVYKLAQEFKVSSEALVQMLRGMGIPVKSHMSTVDESLRTEIKKKFELERAEIKKEYERKKQILTRAREELNGDEGGGVTPVEPASPVANESSAPSASTPASETASEKAPAVAAHEHNQHIADKPASESPNQSFRAHQHAPRPTQQSSYQYNRDQRNEQPRSGSSEQNRGGGGGFDRNRQGGGQQQGEYRGGGGGGGGGGYNRGPGGQGGDNRGGFGGGGGGGGYNRGPGGQSGDNRGGFGGGGGGGGYNRGPGGQGGDNRGGFGGGGGGGGYNRGPGGAPGGDNRGGGGGYNRGPGGFGDNRGGGGFNRGPGGPGGENRGGGFDRDSRPPRDAAAPGGPNKFNEMPLPPPSPDEIGRGFNKKDKKKGKTKKKNERPEVAEFELKANVKKTLAKIGSGFSKKKYKKEANLKDEEEVGERKILNVAEFVTVSELANMLGLSTAEVMTKCLELGLFVTINQRLDFETIELLVDEFGYTAQLMSEYEPDITEDEDDNDVTKMVPRAPVVTVMGHVDHGKTSLLDYIRKANVMAGEAGGITQHIAAYEVHTKQGSVTFLDTPGHEAFTAMRARGSHITDVIVLVVAADSGVMPQTKEAIDHAKAANVPIVVALNKTDLPTANLDRVKGELAQYNVLVEEYGGQVSCVEISAKTGKNMDKLLEVLALETEILELRANPTGFAQGVVVESELDKGKGPIATVLIEKGTLKKGDAFVTGIHYGRVRELYNELGKAVETARPSQPVLVLGISGTPQAGDSFRVVENEKEAREIAARRRLAQKERELRHMGIVSLDHLYEQIKAGNVQTLNLIVKGDVDGSVEALGASLEKLSTEEIKVRVLHKSVGAIKETDVMLAAASNALIVGFHLSPNTKIRELAKREGVEIRTYRIIYECLEDVHSAMEGMLKPEIKENIVGEVEIRRVFKISKFGTVAGCYVLSGTVTRNAKARLIREDIVIAESKISTLRRVQDDVKEVATGYECGITIDNYSDYQEGDRLEIYEEVEVARKLSTTI
jgi:translation initiation factor IF-2